MDSINSKIEIRINQDDLDRLEKIVNFAGEKLYCRWEHPFNFGNFEVWQTTCGKTFNFSSGGPTGGGYNFCPCCGKVIEVIADSRASIESEGSKDEKG